MKYRSTRQLVDDLQRHRRLLIVEEEVDPHLELAEIHRRVYRSGGPAILFNNVRNCRFPVASNLFGTLDQARFLFRHTLQSVRQAVRWKVDPSEALKNPWELWRAPLVGWNMRPRSVRNAAVMQNACKLSELPHVTCWPEDGGAFVTLPQVMSQSVSHPSFSGLNLGMYRVQLNGNDYVPEQECGLHYQIHRGIGVHHSQAIERGQPLPVNITVGGSPAMTLSAVMPLPEGMSELMFAGALAGYRIPLCRHSVGTGSGMAPLYADADFAITGQIMPSGLKPEGPFGDHLGYYAKVHDFPVLQIQHVYHRTGAVWPMTVVGRPPQEDTTFGQLIHELTGPVIPSVLPGVKQVNAVDAAGVHPLLLAVGSERYTPYLKQSRPQELLTQASAILGQGQLSLAKYLWIIDGNDPATPSAEDIQAFLEHALRRVDWRRDLHFHTCTTIDTLDYTGDGLNQGSKLVIASSGPPLRELPTQIASDCNLPSSWRAAQVALPGVLVVEASSYRSRHSQSALQAECDQVSITDPLNAFPLIVVVDDSRFAARNLNNFLWTTFTRSNPAVDVYGVGASQVDKHFGCEGSLIIDARSKPHHASGLIEDPETLSKVDARAARGGELAKYL
ncbi:UbiD family decarboxylase [Aureliella helgolandensis]|uniref:4-hydroxybenzoate decarboxylase subunit C n=1 Tax=Aureliella helgolandensis TaxID=2527968 RepID=A0A518G3W8_9BACT|nr:UbiD family decarboxylase [Aureliella helgolandensis]QDV23265.1 4-hydroxybenzoate decarboxylase subunit C [Aureliella helgolandensis]